LVSWGLRALLSGLSSFVPPGAASLSASIPSQSLSVQDADVDIFNATALELLVEDYKARHSISLPQPARTLSIDPSWPTSHPSSTWRYSRVLQRRQAQCSSGTPVVCDGASREGPACNACSTCCPDGAGGFSCCQQGFKCCGGSGNTPGLCCPDNGEACGTGSCVQPPYVPLWKSHVWAC
jgi:hypothetical protein